tara:strand:+ start:13324 stop:13533 length:210 start_codon:yes stop_codon:yes gene_type:complete
MTEATPTLIEQLREIVNKMAVLERRKERLQKNIEKTDAEMVELTTKLTGLQGGNNAKADKPAAGERKAA